MGLCHLLHLSHPSHSIAEIREVAAHTRMITHGPSLIQPPQPICPLPAGPKMGHAPPLQPPTRQLHKSFRAFQRVTICFRQQRYGAMLSTRGIILSVSLPPRDNRLRLDYPHISRSKRPAVHKVYAETPEALEVRARRVLDLVDDVYELLPSLRPEHRPLVARWAELEVIICAAFAGICQKGMFSVDEESRDVGVKRLVHDYRMLVQTQTVIARELQITPSAVAQLRGESPVDLVGLLAQAAVAETVETVQPEPPESESES